MKQLYKQNKMNKLKLNKIENLSNSSVKIAHLTLIMDTIHFGEILTFKLSCAGHNLRVESSHLTRELKHLMEWLNKSSENKDNLRSNESEIIIFAKDMIKCNEQLKEIKTL
jgi:hypothetical protein